MIIAYPVVVQGLASATTQDLMRALSQAGTRVHIACPRGVQWLITMFAAALQV